MTMTRLFPWLVVFVLSALPAVAEISVGYTAEWLAHASSLVAVATPQQVEEFTGKQGGQFVKIHYRLDDVLKGPSSPGDMATVYHYAAKAQFLASMPGNAQQLLIFCTAARHTFQDIDGKYIFTENREFLSAYGVGLPVRKLFTPDFRLLTTYAELLERSKAQIAYATNLEHQYWAGVITERRLEVPWGTEANRALYAGSTSYLRVPDYREILTVPSHWSQPSGNLAGRLRFELTRDGYCIVLAELKNEGGEPIRITNHLPVSVTVRNATGMLVEQTGLPVDFMMPQPQTAIIPTWGILALRVDEASVAGRDGKTILQIGGQGWTLAPGRYRINGKLTIEHGEGWQGTLLFPEEQIIVPAPLPFGEVIAR